MLYALNLYSDVCQLFLNETWKKRKKKGWDVTKDCDFHLDGTFLSSHLLGLLKPDAYYEML